MRKYNFLWKWIQKNGDDRFSLTFSEIEKFVLLFRYIIMNDAVREVV